MNLPSFLCIGAQKAATSWLYTQLRQHPEIWMPPVKELHFFDHLYVPEVRKWSQDHLKHHARSLIQWHVEKEDFINLRYIQYVTDIALTDVFTERWYRRSYERPAASGKVLGDITPEYCTIPTEGVKYVKELLGDVKIIYIIRDPKERAMSQLRMALERRNDLRDKELSSADWSELLTATPILHRGDYAAYMPRWLEVFPRDNFLFVPFKAVNRNPHKTLRSIESHLSISRFNKYENPTSPVHSTSKTASIPEDVFKDYEPEFIKQREYIARTLGEGFLADI